MMALHNFEMVLFPIFLCLITAISSSVNDELSRKHISLQVEKMPDLNLEENVGEPLILTPYINSGQIEEGQRLSRVTNLTEEVASYSGYFTVNSTYNSNMFFWYIPATFHPEKAPVLVWLQGGPGVTSLYGLFTENGPFIIDDKLEVLLRSTSWSLTHNLVYFDNPVGAGFSFTDHDEGYARNEDHVAQNLYSAITQFLTLFPSLQKRDFYVSGESYAGKYVPAICRKIHEENQRSPEVKVNLRGMAIGDGITDPINMMNYGEYLYNVGLLNSRQKEYFQREEEKARKSILDGRNMDAFNIFHDLILGDLSYFNNVTGMTSHYNILMDKQAISGPYATFVQLPHVRRSIHVGNQSFIDSNSKVESFLREDICRSEVNSVVELLDAKENYQVLFYSGQLDIIVASILTENFLNKMKWHGSAQWADAERKIWRDVGGNVAGYVTVVDNLSYVLVRKSGHMVPADQPKWAFEMINRFTYNKPY